MTSFWNNLHQVHYACKSKDWKAK